MKTILLDMDGVIADFFNHSLNLWGITLDAYLQHNPCRPIEYNVGKWVQELRPDDVTITGNPWTPGSWFEGAIANNAMLYDFWLSMPEYTWAEELIDMCFAHTSHLYICTKPMRHSECHMQKHAWLSAHYPELADKLIITTNKTLLAHPEHILIDDLEDSVRHFSNRGGQGILFPQPWNSNHAIVDRLGHVRHMLKEIEVYI